MTVTTLFPAWKQAVKEFIDAGFKDGEIVQHSWFESALGLNPMTGMATMEQVKKRQFDWLTGISNLRETLLEDHSIYLHSVHGQGYMLAPPGDQTRLAQEKFERESATTYRQAAMRLRHVRVEVLTEAQRRENMDAVAKLSMLRGMQKGAITAD